MYNKFLKIKFFVKRDEKLCPKIYIQTEYKAQIDVDSDDGGNYQILP